MASETKKHHFNTNQQQFPDIIDGKLPIVEFLEASRGVVVLIEKFGKMYSAMSRDVEGNIFKLQKCFDSFPENCKPDYLEDLILKDKEQGSGLAIDALLWLRRALNFFLIIFERVAQFEEQDSLKPHIDVAYKDCLEPYHGWATRKLFALFKSLAPSRTNLLIALSEDADAPQVISAISLFVKQLAVVVHHLKQFYLQNGLESEAKVS